jgi:hypothetical protein
MYTLQQLRAIAARVMGQLHLGLAVSAAAAAAAAAERPCCMVAAA